MEIAPHETKEPYYMLDESNISDQRLKVDTRWTTTSLQYPYSIAKQLHQPDDLVTHIV